MLQFGLRNVYVGAMCRRPSDAGISALSYFFPVLFVNNRTNVRSFGGLMGQAAVFFTSEAREGDILVPETWSDRQMGAGGIDEGARGALEVGQELPLHVGREFGFLHRRRHVLHPPITNLLIDGKRLMPDSERGNAALFGVEAWATEELDEEERKVAPWSVQLRWVEGAEDWVTLDSLVEASCQVVKGCFTTGGLENRNRRIALHSGSHGNTNLASRNHSWEPGGPGP